MHVEAVIEIAREWVETRGREEPGFCGAHLMGSINQMSSDADFPSYKDVDMHMVADGEGRMVDQLYRGVYLECAVGESDRYATPERILADPEIAPHLAIDSIISDPDKKLADLQRIVARDYAKRPWVVARLDREKEWASSYWEQSRHEDSTGGVWYRLSWMFNFLAGLVAIADLAPPTHRRSLVLMGDILKREGRPDILESVLELWGFAQLTKSDVESLLLDCGKLFDLATEVTKTPVPFQFKLRPFIRPYVVEGAQEMINEGHYREAVYWIALFTTVANSAIQADGKDAQRAWAHSLHDRLLAMTDWLEVSDLDARISRARFLMEDVFAFADDLANRNPQIISSSEIND